MLIRKKPLVSDVKKEINKDFYEVLSDFSSGLANANYNLDIFYKNVNGLDVKKVKEKDMSMASNVCQYNFVTNSIYYLKSHFLLGIMHELFHMSSTVNVDDKYVYSGFLQYNLETNEAIGSGLDEAYSVILDQRYFGDYCTHKEEFNNNSYAVTKYLVGMLEDIVGQDVMEKLYSEADLYGLAKKLTMFTSKEETFRFIRNLDYICYYFESFRIPRHIRGVLHCYQRCMMYIGTLYINVLEYVHCQNLISNDEYNELLTNIKKLVTTPLRVGKFIKISSPVMDDEIYDSFFKNTLLESKKRIRLIV